MAGRAPSAKLGFSGIALLCALAPAAPRASAAAPLEPPTRTARAEDGVAALRQPGTSGVLIPGGTFLMGAAPDELEAAIDMCRRGPFGDEICEQLFLNELEPHPVLLSAYFIDRTEVTVAAYQRCAEVGRCRPPPFGNGGRRFDRRDLPVTLVDWQDAQDYCAFVGGRLPTEAEWERAARGPDARRFPWGELYNARLCNHGASPPRRLGILLDPTDARDGFAELAPVGSFPEGRTADGIDDLAGNAAEWVADSINASSLDDLLNARYPAATEVNPKGPGTGAFRVVRGGSWMDGPVLLRGAARSFLPAAAREPTVGFRCVHPAKGS